MGLLTVLSPTRIQRDLDTCISCKSCRQRVPIICRWIKSAILSVRNATDAWSVRWSVRLKIRWSLKR